MCAHVEEVDLCRGSAPKTALPASLVAVVQMLRGNTVKSGLEAP